MNAPFEIEQLVSSDERHTDSVRQRCIKRITALIGDAGLREFLRQRQPAFDDLTGGMILQNHPHELLERLQFLTKPSR